MGQGNIGGLGPKTGLTSGRVTTSNDDVQSTEVQKPTSVATVSKPSVSTQGEVDAVDHTRPTLDNTPQAANTRRGGSGVLPFQVADLLAPTNASRTGPNAPIRAEVDSLLSAYGVQQLATGATRLGRPAERLMRWAAQIHDKVTDAVAQSGGDVSKVVDVFVDKDIRRQVFLLEGALKFYKKAYPDMEPALVQVKALEDQLGAVKGTSGMLALAQEKGAPKAVIDVLQHHSEAARDSLQALVTQEWTPDKDGQIPVISSFLETLQELPWMSYDDDKSFVRGEFSRRLKKTEKVPYEMDQLQGDFGVHELRRNLRWVPIYAEALDGLVKTDPENNPVKAYKGLLKEDIADSKFMRLPDSDREDGPIEVSKSLYAATMTLVLGFGALKDRGEEIEELSHAYLEAGVANSPKAAEKATLALLGFDKKEPKALTKNAGKLYDEMSDNKLFKAMRKDYTRRRQD